MIGSSDSACIMGSMNESTEIQRLAILRYQFEQQMLYIRSNRNECKCAVKSGRRDDYRTDKTCDLCGPFIINFHRARTQLDREIASMLDAAGFDPRLKAEQHVNNYLTRSLEFAGKESLHV